MNERLSAKHAKWLWGGLAAVLIVAVFFRFWQIDSIPPGLFGDEATDGVDALDVLAGRGQLFFPANYGREGLHMWIVALSLKLLGVSPLAVRLPSILAGILTALATFWLGYEMFVHRQNRSDERQMQGSRLWIYLIPLLAALYVSTSFWHVHFSRFGIRGVFTTTTTALTMAALWRALNAQRAPNAHPWRWFAISGIFLGLGMHFYTASRFVPIALVVFYGIWLLFSLLGMRQQERSSSVLPFLAGVVIQFVVAALIFFPLGYYFLTHPGSFMQRAGEVSVFQGGLSIEALATISRAASANLLQFVWPGSGDQAQFYNLPGRAIFDPLTAVLALIGIVISAKRWRNPVYSFLLVWFVVMALPAFIAVDRYPTLPRLLGVIPGIYFFPAIGLSALVGFIIRRLGGTRRLAEITAVGIVVIALLVHAGLTFRDYFRIWGPAPATATAFESDMTAAWRWLEAHPDADNGQVYLSSDIFRHPTFMFLHEHTPTSEWFTWRNPNLHWFDGRGAWPMPAPDPPSTILVGDSALPPDFIKTLLDLELDPVEDGTVMLAQSNAQLDTPLDVQFTDQLTLLDQFVVTPAESEELVIVQVWQTNGPEGEDWRRYQIQSALLDDSGEQLAQGSDDMRFVSTEWPENGIFITWQVVPWPDAEKVAGTALSLVPEGEAPLQPVGSEDGWLTFGW